MIYELQIKLDYKDIMYIVGKKNIDQQNHILYNKC